MVSVAAFCPGDLISSPDQFAVSNLNWKIEFTRIRQVYDQKMPIVITVTVCSLVAINKLILKICIANWRCSRIAHTDKNVDYEESAQPQTR